jgi:hypothetical protein
MPGRAPKTDKWTARENKRKKPDTVLIVSGLVQVTNTNMMPRLTEAAGPGRKAQTLTLNLSIAADSGPGNDVLVWKHASFDKKVTVDQYNDVDIHWDGKSIATCKVLDDDEHHQHLVKLTQAANAQFAKKPKPAARSKPKAKAKTARRLKAKTKTKTKAKTAARAAHKAPRKKKR